MNEHIIINIHNKYFKMDSTIFPVLRGIRFNIPSGFFFTLLGPSGCGKTTLLRLIAGLDNLYEGEIFIRGKLVQKPDRRCGIVFQEARLLRWKTVEENVRFVLPGNLPYGEKQSLVEEVLALVGLLEFRNFLPKQLSGGMARRVELARALVNLPDILLLDEPFTGLDSYTKYSLQDEILRIVNNRQITILQVTHDIDDAVYMSDQIAILGSRPATISKIFTVDFPKPRMRSSETLSLMRNSILDEILIHREN